MKTNINEGIKDYLSLIATKLKGVIDDRNLGRGEVINLTKAAKSKFSQYMGRMNQTWDTVTWDTLFKYLSMSDQLGLEQKEIYEIFGNASTKTSISNLLTSQNILSPDYFTTYWAKKSQPIGGVGPSAKQCGEIVATYLLELGAIRHLDKKSGGMEMPSPPTSSNNNTGTTNSTSTTSGNSTTGPLVKPTPPTKTGDINKDNMLDAIYKLQMASYILQGGQP